MAIEAREAARNERERIVAFIRMKADKPWHVDNERAIVRAIAAAIEAGEHLTQPKAVADADRR